MEMTLVTITDYITLISAVAALLTALATLFIVFEMRRQRLSAFQPEFAIIQSDLHVWRSKHNFFQITMDDDEPELFNEMMRVALKIVNVGLGAAKAIQVQWDFDILNFINTIKSYDHDDEFNIVFEDEHLSISNTEKKDLSVICSHGEQFIEKLPYILPATVELTPRTLALPSSYLSLLKVWTDLSCNNLASNDSRPSFQDIPDLIVKISYKDIGKTLRKRSFKIKLGPFKLLGHKPKEDDSFLECMVAILEVSEL